MKEKLVAALQKTKEDAKFAVYHFTSGDNYKLELQSKAYVENLLEHCSDVTLHQSHKDVIMLGDVGLSIRSVDENIYYETPDTEGYFEYKSKYNPYYNIFIRLDKENKTIEFKLGDKHKKLELIEEGFDGYVSKPHRGKYMRCVSAEDLEKHIHDEFWNPRMVRIGRRVLNIKSFLEDELSKKTAALI
jgi:hypothetical protein